MIRVSLTISGQVQGVFFRTHAKEKADELRLTGWVGNNADDTVTMVIEGEENQVHNLSDWCHSGPSNAQVKKVRIDYEPYTDEFEDFSIRY